MQNTLLSQSATGFVKPAFQNGEILGDIRGNNFIETMKQLKDTVYPDYKWLGSIGFTNIAEKTWRLILKKLDFSELLNNKKLLSIMNIKGIGTYVVDTIAKEIPYFIEDINYIFNNYKYIKSSEMQDLPQVRFSGLRDYLIATYLENKGYDADPDGSVNKDTTILVIPYYGYNSTKVKKAFGLLSKRYSEANNTDININWDNIHLVNGIKPMILSAADVFEKL